jgi:hypothetical protein
LTSKLPADVTVESIVAQEKAITVWAEYILGLEAKQEIDEFPIYSPNMGSDQPIVEKRNISRFDPVQTELNMGDICPTGEARLILKFPAWQKIDMFQKVTYLDAIYQPYYYDKVCYSVCVLQN